MRVKHATLGKDAEGNIIFVYPSQNKQRDTSASYSPYTNVLVIAGKTIEKHPKFPNVEKFEGFVNTYFAEGKDEPVLQQTETKMLNKGNAMIKYQETTYYRVRARIEDWGVDIKVGRLKDSDPIHKYLPDIFCPPDNLNDDGTAEFELGTTGMGYLTLSELDNYQKAINEAIIAVKKFSAVDWRNV